MASYPLSIVSGKLRVGRTNGRLIIIINNYGRATSMFSTSFLMHLNTSLSRQFRNSTIQSECFISNYFANPNYRDRSLHSQKTTHSQYPKSHFYCFYNKYHIDDWGRFYYRMYWGVYWISRLPHKRACTAWFFSISAVGNYDYTHSYVFLFRCPRIIYREFWTKKNWKRQRE